MDKLNTDLTPSLHNFSTPNDVTTALERIIVWRHQGARERMPPHLRRCPTMKLCTAAELRRDGVPVPLLIPDEGTVPCEGVHVNHINNATQPDGLYNVFSAAFTMPFEWTDATGRDNTALLGVLYYKKRAPPASPT